MSRAEISVNKHTVTEGYLVKKTLLLALNISACMTNTALPMELPPTYVPHSASTYVIATALVASMYGASQLYATYSHPLPLTITLESIDALTCTPAPNNADRTNKAIPWHTLVEQMQQHTLPQETIMQVESDDAKTIDLQKGIEPKPEHDTVFVFSRGFATRGGLISGTPLADRYQDIVNKGGGLMAGHMAIKDNLVTDAPCYSFDYPDTPRYLNLGQASDSQRLNTVWEEILRKNPQVGIVGMGDCRGSKALLEFATTQPEQLKALVLMAPFVSLQELTRHIARNYLPFPYSDKLLLALMHYALPSVKIEEDTLSHRLNLINSKMPIFIAHRVNDSVISYNDIQLLVNTLQKGGNQDVYLLEVKDESASHSRLSHIPELQQALNAFYARYNLPHNAMLAQEGEMLLKKAKKAAQSMVSKGQSPKNNP